MQDEGELLDSSATPSVANLCNSDLYLEGVAICQQLRRRYGTLHLQAGVRELVMITFIVLCHLSYLPQPIVKVDLYRPETAFSSAQAERTLLTHWHLLREYLVRKGGKRHNQEDELMYIDGGLAALREVCEDLVVVLGEVEAKTALGDCTYSSQMGIPMASTLIIPLCSDPFLIYDTSVTESRNKSRQEWLRFAETRRWELASWLLERIEGFFPSFSDGSVRQSSLIILILAYESHLSDAAPQRVVARGGAVRTRMPSIIFLSVSVFRRKGSLTSESHKKLL